MKAMLPDLIRGQPDASRQRHLVREYLQFRILLALHDHHAFTNWAFVGGTALRLLFRLPRFSEDLDFSLTARGEDARFGALLRGVRADLEAEAYQVEVKSREQRTVAAAFIRFRGLLHELGLSPHPDETLAVKVEIDTNPPTGATLATTVIRRQAMLRLLHHDRGSLLAGKLHAVLARRHTKGRDLYDLAWYLADSDWPEPNLLLLNRALRQTGWTGRRLTPGTWRRAVANHLRQVDWPKARADVSPFLERTQDLDLVGPETLQGLLSHA